jgi:ATP-dependent exoDNAse (exonuclease V) alpha subunit
LNVLKHRNFDHGYAVTSYSSQSQTADRVLIHVDSDHAPGGLSTRFAYVAISRARKDAQLYTNDAETLGQFLGRDVTKSSAIQQGALEIELHSIKESKLVQGYGISL